jgi:single-strand DNA-binding protein
MSLNRCTIIGNLGADPELKYTTSGQGVANFGVATNRRWKDKHDEWQEETEWFRVVLWGDAAERAADQLRKGHRVYVEGRMQTRSWEDRDGGKRYTTELIADKFFSLEKREDNERPSRDERPARRPARRDDRETRMEGRDPVRSERATRSSTPDDPDSFPF